MSSAICFNLDQSKILSSANGLSLCNGQHQGPYLLTILKNILCLVLQIFLCLEAFECNTTSDWLNRRFSQSEVVLHSDSQKSVTRNVFQKDTGRNPETEFFSLV